jgi:hypothetical protein
VAAAAQIGKLIVERTRPRSLTLTAGRFGWQRGKLRLGAGDGVSQQRLVDLPAHDLSLASHVHARSLRSAADGLAAPSLHEARDGAEQVFVAVRLDDVRVGAKL